MEEMQGYLFSEEFSAEIAEYRRKEEWLDSRYRRLSQWEFYRGLFPEGSFEVRGVDCGRANGIVNFCVRDGTRRRVSRIVFDDLEMLQYASSMPSPIISPLGYFGRRRTLANAMWLYGIAIDLDGVTAPRHLDNLEAQFEFPHLPTPTAIVSSGHGLHLYYFFYEPYAMFHKLQQGLNLLKEGLTRKIWNRYVTSQYHSPQIQSINQGMSVVGGRSKIPGISVTAWLSGERTDLEVLNGFVKLDRDYRIKDLEQYRTKSELERMGYDGRKEKVVRPRTTVHGWKSPRALYDWWKDMLLESASVGHRYNCCGALAIIGWKCGVSREELLRDVLEMQPAFDGLARNASEGFSVQDAKDALSMYNERAQTAPLRWLERLIGIRIERNRRNGLNREEHLELARLRQKQIARATGKNWRNVDGRPDKQEIVMRWRREFPDGRKIDCERETGLSRHTVLKWWNTADPLSSANGKS